MTCPPSLREVNDGPAALDPAFLARLSQADQIYITNHESQWEAVKNADQNAKADALEACHDFNVRARQAVSHEN